MKLKTVFMAGLVGIMGLTLANCSNSKHGFRRIHFDLDKSFVRSDMIPIMDRNVELMKKRRRHFSTKSIYGSGGAWEITVEGHCDERGTNEYNYALGARRAESTKSYMVTHGVSADRIKTVSYGEDRPLRKGHNEEAWYYNRRAEFVVTK